jgi:hypothetical protein
MLAMNCLTADEGEERIKAAYGANYSMNIVHPSRQLHCSPPG